MCVGGGLEPPSPAAGGVACEGVLSLGLAVVTVPHKNSVGE